MIKADSHLHSWHSVDSTCPMEDIVLKAIELGLEEITFTEHVEHDGRPGAEFDYEKYFEGIAQMREKYGDKIRIKAGIEFGLQTHTIELFWDDLKKYEFDLIILSAHSVRGQHIASGEYAAGKTQEELHHIYYENTLQMMREFKNYSVLGHVDYIKRYDEHGEYSDDHIAEVVGKIFHQAIADGKGIEVNTSSFKYNMPDLTPSRRLLQLYYDLGGRIITIGSDAHNTEYVADHFEEIKEVLKEIGFTEICTFEKMEPVFHKL